MRLPCISVMATCVLLNVARMFATPVVTFFACLALTIFFALASSPKSSAAVGAATVTGVSAIAADSEAAAGAPFFSTASAADLPSFFGADFFLISSAIIIIQILGDTGFGIRIALHTNRLA